MGLILAAKPHRVFISRLGRIEVYQPIPPPSGRSPGGAAHPCVAKLLKIGRTHPATEPIPGGWCHARISIRRIRRATRLGGARPFDAAHHRAFQAMLVACGDAEAYGVKQRVLDAVRAGEAPASIAASRHGRTSIRIALRQMKLQGYASATLDAWLANFDLGSTHDRDDTAELHGHD